MIAGRVYAAPRGALPGETPDETPPQIVVVGAASRDLAPADRRGWRLGGAVSYCSLTAARLGLRVGAVMGLDAEAASAEELALLRQAGVDVRPVALEHGPVFENIEGPDGRRRQRWLSKADRIDVVAAPPEWRSVGAWLLGPVAGEVGEEWAAVPSGEARVAVGWQGLLREFALSGWVERVAPAPSRLPARAGLACLSRDDAPGAEPLELRRLAPRATIVLTEGAGGGRVLDPAGGVVRYDAVQAREVDPTGAGDVFLAALIVRWLRGASPAAPSTLAFAAAAASCAIEGEGIVAAPWTREVESRLWRTPHPPRR